MKRILLILTSLILVSCDTQQSQPDLSQLPSIDGGNVMTTRTIKEKESAKFECVDSYTGSCFFSASSSSCAREGFLFMRERCISTTIMNFELLPGESREFTLSKGEEVLHCALPSKPEGKNACTLS